MKYTNDYTPKKRVTKNDKKQKGEVYSQKHIRLVLKQMESRVSNAPKSEAIDRAGIRPPKVGGMADPSGKYVDSE
jgi:hypothetical protein